MKKMFQILTKILKGSKVLKGLKIIKELLNFIKFIAIIIGGTFIINALEFINGIKFLNSNITSLLITCISWILYLYIIAQSIKTLLRFAPLIREITENPITKKIAYKIKKSFKEWQAIARAKTHKED